VRCAPDAAEETLIVFSPAERQLRIDRSHSSLSPDADDAPRGGVVDLGEGERLKLNVFLDGSVVEVFANGRACLTERIYPTRPDSLGLGLFASDGTARVVALDIWEMGEA
jgi:beta-fructofuranosidase